MSAFVKFLTALLTAVRALVGLLIVYAGLELIRGNSLFRDSPYDSAFSGAFVMLIGVVCIIGAIFPHLFHNQR